MASSPPLHSNSHTLILEETPNSTPFFRSMVRRTPSFSSSSPSHSRDSSFDSSFNEEFPPYSPIVSTPLKFKGIPFSWEQIPGIPKQQGCKKKETLGHLLPLPPAGNANSSTKKLHKKEEISPKKDQRFLRDPFFAALVECSKDDDHDHKHDHGTNFGNIWKGSSKIIARSLSDRFGFLNMYTSCKRTCGVSESIVYLPRTSPHYLLNRRPR